MRSNLIAWRMKGCLSLALLAVAAGCAEPDPLDPAPELEADEADTLDEETAPPIEYPYVRIVDLSASDGGPQTGADIDAVVGYRGMTVLYASAVIAFVPEVPDPLDPEAALGAPDAFPNYPDVASCLVDSGSVSLGGSWGELSLRMSTPLQSGDRLEVLEVGGCDYGPGTAIIEELEVSVGRGPESAIEWLVLGQETGPVAAFVIP